MIKKIVNENKGKFAVLLPFRWNEKSLKIHSVCLFYGLYRGIKFQRYTGYKKNCICVYNDDPKFIMYYYNLAARFKAEKFLMKDSEDRVYIIYTAGENEGKIIQTDKKWNQETVKKIISDKIIDTKSITYNSEKYSYQGSGMMARASAIAVWGGKKHLNNLIVEKKIAEQIGIKDYIMLFTPMFTEINKREV